MSGWLKLSKVKLIISFGGKNRVIDGDNPLGGAIVAEEIMDNLTSRVAENAEVRLGNLAKILPELVEKSYLEAVNFAAKSMIGTTSPRGADNRSANKGQVTIKAPDGDTITRWQVLAPRTIREQNAIRGVRDSGKFFSQTGQLKEEVVRVATSYVKSHPMIKVRYNGKLRDTRGRFVSPIASRKRITMGNLTLNLMPGINRNLLGGITAGDLNKGDPNLGFEQKLGFSPSAIRKLRGAGKGTFVIPGTHRPLLQPVFTYWTLNRVPQMIARAINRSVVRAPRVDNSSGQVFTGI